MLNTFTLVHLGNISLITCLNFSGILFIIGLVGIIWNKRNFLVMLLCIELMFFSVSLNFVFFSVFTYNTIGQLYCLLIITVAAAETSIGLSLLVIAHRLGSIVNYKTLITLRG